MLRRKPFPFSMEELQAALTEAIRGNMTVTVMGPDKAELAYRNGLIVLHRHNGNIGVSWRRKTGERGVPQSLTSWLAPCLRFPDGNLLYRHGGSHVKLSPDSIRHARRTWRFSAADLRQALLSDIIAPQSACYRMSLERKSWALRGQSGRVWSLTDWGGNLAVVRVTDRPFDIHRYPNTAIDVTDHAAVRFRGRLATEWEANCGQHDVSGGVDAAFLLKRLKQQSPICTGHFGNQALLVTQELMAVLTVTRYHSAKVITVWRTELVDIGVALLPYLLGEIALSSGEGTPEPSHCGIIG